MTALTQFDRLESGGIWRLSPDSDPVDATVSFGKATLVIADGTGLPLTHWSLPAVIRTNPGSRPAIFANDGDDEETLEVDDDLMIDAIETVRKTLDRARPRPPRLRFMTSLLVLAAFVGGAVAFGPAALKSQTLTAVPASKRAEIGATILGHYQRLTGTTCRGAAATQVLTELATRLWGRDAARQIVVVQDLTQGAAQLPGGIVMLDRALVEQQDDVAVTAGFLLAATVGRAQTDPLGNLLDFAGPQATFTLFTTGDLPSDILARFATAMRDQTLPIEDADQLAAAFAAADIVIQPYAQFRDPQASRLAALMDASETPPAQIMSDSDWVRLQSICDS